MAYMTLPTLDWYSVLVIASAGLVGHGGSAAASIGVEIPLQSGNPKHSRIFIIYLV